MSYIIQFMHKCVAVARFWSPLAAISGLQQVCIQFHHDIWWLLTFPVRPPTVGLKTSETNDGGGSTGLVASIAYELSNLGW